MKNLIIGVLVIALLGAGYYFYSNNPKSDQPVGEKSASETTPPNMPTTTTPTDAKPSDHQELGASVEGRDIDSYTFGTGDKKVVFVGGIHGGYGWSTALVAYELINYLKANPNAVPQNVQVTVIPVLNPDGLAKVVAKEGEFTAADVNSSKELQIAGRYNGNKVDLNRNFDCAWKATGKWQNTTVNGGSAPFSEPESKAFKTFIESYRPNAVVGWYSSAGGVYSSKCGGSVMSETATLNQVYAKASGYPSHETFDSYEVTGDMMDWLAKEKIAAVSVLLTSHEATEWQKNKAGIEAVIQHIAK
ncbi:MAG: hypothetical protein RIQ56_186 [Candidatus Parcubacteria bacterium]|jgi:hypothetical protein